MNESQPNQSEALKVIFAKPDFISERGEFERVADTFGIDTSVLEWAFNQGHMVALNEEMWSNLDNTDSYTIEKDGHEQAEKNSQMVGRDYRAVAEAMYAGVVKGEPLHAPIIMKMGEAYHVVSGNTRLMASRAYGITPQVWIFEVDDNGN